MKIANIGPREGQKRLGFGLAMLALAIGMAAGLIFFHAGSSWRLLLFIPFWLAALGLLQAREKT